MRSVDDYTHIFIDKKSNRTLLLLHGTGGSEEDLISFGESVDPEANLLALRGKVNENGLLRFFKRFANGMPDEKDVVFRSKELAEFLKIASRHYDFDLNEIVGIGYSNGANMLASVILLLPGVITKAILLRPFTPLSSPQAVDLKGTRVLICGGEHDHIIKPTETQRLHDLLHLYGATVVMLWHDIGHSLVEEDILASQKWISEL